MHEMLFLIFKFIAGLALGIVFFGGLWFTVKKTLRSAKAPIWVLASFLVRLSITLLGFYYISLGNLKGLLICLLGFVAGRIGVIHYTKSLEIKQAQLAKEVENEA